MAFHRQTKLRAIDYKGGSCQMCGYNACAAALEFYYVAGDTDSHSPINNKQSRKWNIVREKLDRCILVCSNCHREIHNGMHDADHLAGLLTVPDVDPTLENTKGRKG